MLALKRAVWIVFCFGCFSTAEAVQGSPLSLQGVDDIHGRHGFALGMLAIGDRIADHVFQKQLQHTSDFFVNQSGNSLHSASARQSANRGLRYALDVISQHFAMTLSASFSQAFATFATSRHSVCR